MKACTGAHSNLSAYLLQPSHRSGPPADARRLCILRRWARGSEGRSSGPVRTRPEGTGPAAQKRLHSHALPLEPPPDDSLCPSGGNRRAPLLGWGRPLAARRCPDRPEPATKARLRRERASGHATLFKTSLSVKTGRDSKRFFWQRQPEHSCIKLHASALTTATIPLSSAP